MQFDFGKNWKDFSQNVLTEEKIQQARQDFASLMADLPLKDKLFLDIGFGQGISLFLAKEMGANVSGVDINPKCKEVLYKNQQQYFGKFKQNIPVEIGSILDSSVLEKTKRIGINRGYDVVHSWGVLHHTGNMNLAIQNAASLVAEQGYLVLAIYNRHWSSPYWIWIKWFYCKSPKSIKKIMIGIFYPVIYFAKLLTTRDNPLKQSRGMVFFTI